MGDSLRSSRRTPLRACAVALLLVAGCDPAWKMSGSVRGDGDTPIANATISTRCPENRAPLPSTTTDASGVIRGGGVGFFGDNCTIEVAAPGYQTRTFPVNSVCKVRAMGSCTEVDLRRVTLTPTR